ncbi:MAG: hypothetical protein ABF746_08720 [Acetobacter orientalis]|uniref:hypothetical protein n=1 Tax=Acetobacter orientalis TaxID=146474 RepID=UPI0039ED2317
MTSPTVWQDAWARAGLGAKALQIPLLDLLENTLPDNGDGAYLFMEGASGTADRLELGEEADDIETGQIWLHLMAPVGKMKTLDALQARWALAKYFRRAELPFPDGLAYTSRDFDPPDSSATGLYYRFSLVVSYTSQSPP